MQSLCAQATGRLAQLDHRYAAAAIRRLRDLAVAGLPADDSIAVTQYAALCAALLDAVRATQLHLPEARAKLEQADSAARTFIVGQSLAANLVIARVAEVQGDLHLALRAVRRRAGRYDMLPTWYLSSFLKRRATSPHSPGTRLAQLEHTSIIWRSGQIPSLKWCPRSSPFAENSRNC